MSKTRYEWSQEQRRVETAIRRQKDVGVAAQASGDNVLRREAQTNINALTEYYKKISEKSGLATDFSRTRVEGFKEMGKRELQKAAGSDIIFTGRTLGKKSGQHMREWGLNPSSAADREKFVSVSRDIKANADEVRRVRWLFDSDNKRTVEVNAYIFGNDVVLVDDNNVYITTMKDGINNKRVQGGRTIKNGS